MKRDLSFASDIDQLRFVEKAIDELSAELGLSDEIYGNVLVATIEAVNNAIVHGNKANPEKTVRIAICSENEALSIHVQDEGNGFNPEDVPDPTAPENIEKINGRGIFLMERLSDEIQFLDDGRLVSLKFNL